MSEPMTAAEAPPLAGAASARPVGGQGPPALIRIEQVNKVYDTGDELVHALSDVTFSISEGEFVSIVGQSGCGKSTLLNMIAGLDRPTTGTIVLGGKPVLGPRSREVGYVFQRPVLLPWRSVLDNVLIPIELNRWRRDDYLDRARDLLVLVGLEGFEHRYPEQLSGGMQQRAAIVRALVHRPRVLLMDEPFGAVDALTREYLNLELLRIWEATQATIVFVTHDLREAAFLSDRVVALSKRPGTIQEIVGTGLARPRELTATYTERFGTLVTRLGELIG